MWTGLTFPFTAQEVADAQAAGETLTPVWEGDGSSAHLAEAFANFPFDMTTTVNVNAYSEYVAHVMTVLCCVSCCVCTRAADAAAGLLAV